MSGKTALQTSKLLLLATRLGSLTSKASGTKRVLRLDGGSVFFDFVLFGQDVGESARGAARWAAPLH